MVFARKSANWPKSFRFNNVIAICYQVEITKKFKKASSQIKPELKSWQLLSLMLIRRKLQILKAEVVSFEEEEAAIDDRNLLARYITYITPPLIRLYCMFYSYNGWLILRSEMRQFDMLQVSVGIGCTVLNSIVLLVYRIIGTMLFLVTVSANFLPTNE